MLINGKHKFVASTDGCVSVADFVSKKLKDIEVLRGKEVKVTLDDFELIRVVADFDFRQDECVRVKTIDRKGKEEEKGFIPTRAGRAKKKKKKKKKKRLLHPRKRRIG